MDPSNNIPSVASCTTCTFNQDFSNYWTAILYFRARNGTFKRLEQIGNVDFESANGGSTVYYIQPYDGSSVTAFKPVSRFRKLKCSNINAHPQGFRMVVGNPTFRNASQASTYRQLTFTCLQNPSDRTDETDYLPTKACPSGIMSNIRFPTYVSDHLLISPWLTNLT